MTIPVLQDWAQREVITPDKMNAQIRDVQSFLSNKPWFHVMLNDEPDIAKRQSFAPGQDHQLVQWKAPALENGGWTVNDSRTGFIVPEDGVYYAYMNITAVSDHVIPAGAAEPVYFEILKTGEAASMIINHAIVNGYAVASSS